MLHYIKFSRQLKLGRSSPSNQAVRSHNNTKPSSLWRRRGIEGAIDRCARIKDGVLVVSMTRNVLPSGFAPQGSISQLFAGGRITGSQKTESTTSNVFHKRQVWPLSFSRGSEDQPNRFVIAQNSWLSCQFLRLTSLSSFARLGSALAFCLCAFLIFSLNHSGLSCILAIVSPEPIPLVNLEDLPLPPRTVAQPYGQPKRPELEAQILGKVGEHLGLLKESRFPQSHLVSLPPRSLDRASKMGAINYLVNCVKWTHLCHFDTHTPSYTGVISL